MWFDTFNNFADISGATYGGFGDVRVNIRGITLKKIWRCRGFRGKTSTLQIRLPSCFAPCHWAQTCSQIAPHFAISVPRFVNGNSRASGLIEPTSVPAAIRRYHPNHCFALFSSSTYIANHGGVTQRGFAKRFGVGNNLCGLLLVLSDSFDSVATMKLDPTVEKIRNFRGWDNITGICSS